MLAALLALWMAAAAGSASKGSPVKASAAGAAASVAAADEVNLLAHGLLQLGHGLKEHVERTGGQLRELGGRLRAHNASLGRLQRAADEQRQQLGRARRLLDARLDALDARLRALGGELAAQQQQRRRQGLDGGGPAAAEAQLQLQRRPPAENASDGPRGQAEQVGALQNLMSQQNLKIEELFQKIKQQQYRMDKQNLQIKSLQSKVNMLIPLQVKESENPSPKWKANSSPGLDQVANITQKARTNAPETLEIPTNYLKLFSEGHQKRGIFLLQVPDSQPFEVFYDASPDNVGWIVIQRRQDGSVDFDQRWEAYKNGFGNMSGDFWLGLEKVHQIVGAERFHLLVELQDWEGNVEKIQYLFTLGGEDTAYTLSLLGPILGELANAMGDFPQLPFSTRDQDHDLKGDTNCAKHLSGGWWFSGCGHVNLNGKYFRSIPRQRHERKQGIFWKTWKGRYYPLKATTMKIRPADLGPGS